jgi:1-acyl-sn-glycerol-3-phosphate acyltransferase
MLRFYYVILISLPFIIYYIFMAEHYVRNRDRYDEEQCYDLAQRLVRRFKKNARIKTISYGEEHLPEEGGYIMYSNHQGKYDAVGIISSHEKPCSVVMDEERSRIILANQFVELLEGVRLSRTDFKQQVKSAKTIQNGVEHGKRYIYFPEGKYERNGNKLQEFRPGAFNCAKKAKAPIVPVAIYDSHIPFDFNSIRKVTTQVYFLEPIYYDEYEDKTTQEISEMVKGRIEECLEILESKRISLGLNRKFYLN